MLLLGRDDLAALLTPADVIAAVERAFRECAAGRVAALPRAGLPMGRGGVFLAMISALPALGALGTKLATVVEGNQRRGLPTIQATYLLTDPETGTPATILTARIGRGMLVYTSLALDTQLAAVHPGAARLLVNMLTAGMAPARK